MTTPDEITDVDDIPIPTCVCGAGPMVVDRSDAYRCRKCGRELCRVTTMEYRIEELRTELIATRAKIAEVRRRTAQRCAEIADIAARWETRALNSASACKRISDTIRREFALAEQPPISPPAQDAGERQVITEEVKRMQ